MRLKLVEINGFKSFPDKVNIDFGDGITAIVGPNGSGKSNIVDAVRWVLGEQSVKSLRGGKMEDVIFVGSSGRKPVGLAEVSLVIDNQDGTLQTPFTEVKVTRRLYRSGESEYLLGGKPVRLKDINELFMNTGLGRDGYSIIGQGRISEVLSARSDERRTIFEEAAGISKFRYRRNESTRRLEATEANLVRLRDILSGYAERVEPLRRQSEKARKYLDYREERRRLEINVWLDSLDQTQDLISKAVDDHLIVTAQLGDVSARQVEMEQGVERATQETQSINVEIDELLRRQRELADQSAQATSQVAVTETELRHNKQQQEAMRAGMEQSAERRQTLERRSRELQQKKSDKEGERNALTQTIEQQLQQLRRDALQEMERDIAELRLKQLEESDRAAELHAASANATAALAARGEDEARIERELAQLLAGMEQELAQLERVQRELEAARQAVTDNQNAISGRQMLKSGRQKREQEAADAQEQLQRSLTEKQQRHRVQVEMEQSGESFSGAVKLVLEEAARGRLKGVHGAVSSLIQAEARVALAIETALGPAMQNIAVDNELQGKAAIQLLQQRKAGRATFLPLASVKPPRDRPARGESLGVASELVHCDEAYRGIIDFLLGRTLVAQDMDAAIAIAKKNNYRTRVVTLDGQIINAGGSMTGGSQARGTGVLTRRILIEELAKQIAALEQQAEQAKARRAELAAELALLQAELDGAQAELQSAQEEVVRCETQLAGLNSAAQLQLQQKESLERQRDQAQQAAQQLRQQQQQAALELEQSRQAQAELSHALERMQRDHAASSELVAQELEQINQKRISLASLEAELEAVSTQCREAEESIAMAGMDRAQQERQLGELANAFTELTEELERTKQRAEQADAQARQLTQDVAGRTAQRDKTEQRQVALRQQLKEIGEQKENLLLEQARTEARKTQIEQERDNLIASLWDEYELTVSAAQEQRSPMDSKTAAQRRIAELKTAIRGLGHVNVDAIEEYKEVHEKYEFYTEQIGDLEHSKLELEQIVEDLTREMQSIFAVQFKVINEKFGQAFRDLFGGGAAMLSLSDPGDVLESGIDIRVQPEGKVINNLSSLSGGEQALTAIALYFAIMEVRPSPFVILDEIDTALDEVNVLRLANYYTRFTDRTQLILITHRRGAMEACDILYGVTMQEKGVSKLLKIDVNDVERQILQKA